MAIQTAEESALTAAVTEQLERLLESARAGKIRVIAHALIIYQDADDNWLTINTKPYSAFIDGGMRV